MFHFPAVPIDLTGSDDESVVVVQDVQPVVESNPIRRMILGEIVGKPKPKAQPKINRRANGGRGACYYPSTAFSKQVTEKLIANRLEEYPDDNDEPLQGPLTVRLSFYFKATHASQVGMPYDKTPDVDNLQKFFLDAMKHAGYFEDDKQVFRITAVKKYCLSMDDIARTTYSVSETNVTDDVY